MFPCPIDFVFNIALTLNLRNQIMNVTKFEIYYIEVGRSRHYFGG